MLSFVLLFYNSLLEIASVYITLVYTIYGNLCRLCWCICFHENIAEKIRCTDAFGVSSISITIVLIVRILKDSTDILNYERFISYINVFISIYIWNLVSLDVFKLEIRSIPVSTERSSHVRVDFTIILLPRIMIDGIPCFVNC